MHLDKKKILTEWQEEVSSSLVEGFRQLFEASSQVLLEFADAAENNRLQRLFFDAQREFYLREDPIIEEFAQNLRESLQAFANQQSHATQLGADTLSLVEVDDYERSLALETIAKRTQNKHLSELHALAQRLSALLGGRPLKIDQLPANPMQVIRVFDPASRKLEVEKEVRLVFYTLFDRYVMSRLGGLYSRFNERLIESGILPNIKFEYQRFGKQARKPSDEDRKPLAGDDGDPRAAAAGASDPDRRGAAPSSAETLKAISSLLMAKRQQERGQEPPLQTSVPIIPSAANVDEAIGDARVLQEAPHPIPIPTDALASKVAVDAALLLKVKNALQKQRLIIKDLVGRDHLDSHEEDVIDIVGMLFEAMLNEKLLPNSVKTLLSHLHTRYLKIAVQSPDFLDNAAHPARRLFEHMLDAGIRWVRENNLRAGIYPQLQGIVNEILNNENLPEGFFDDQIAILNAAEKKLEQQSSATEERTLEAERGRARLDQAKMIVKRTIDDIANEVEVAPAVITFLTTTYADYLTLLLLRNDLDTDSESWHNALSVGETLIAAASHAASGQALDQATRDALSRQLEGSVGTLIPHHEQNIRRVIDALDAPVDKAAVATAPPSADDADKAADIPLDVEERRVADKLMRNTGEWFVLKQGGGADELAVKLLWVNPHTRNMLFVDQHGSKVALMPAAKAAKMVRTGTLHAMEQETSSFVARSLRRIRRALEDSVNT